MMAQAPTFRNERNSSAYTRVVDSMPLPEADATEAISSLRAAVAAEKDRHASAVQAVKLRIARIESRLALQMLSRALKTADRLHALVKDACPNDGDIVAKTRRVIHGVAAAKVDAKGVGEALARKKMKKDKEDNVEARGGESSE